MLHVNHHQYAVRVPIRINLIKSFVLSVYQGIMDQTAAYHADILTTEKAVNQNVHVRKRLSPYKGM